MQNHDTKKHVITVGLMCTTFISEAVMRLYRRSVQSSPVSARKRVKIPSPIEPNGSGELAGEWGAFSMSISYCCSFSPLSDAGSGRRNIDTPATA